MMRAGGKRWTTQQEHTVADDSKQQNPATTGDERRGKGGRRQRMQLINAYSNKFKVLRRTAAVILLLTRIPIVCLC
jgi:hypothetical protein